MSKHTVSIRFVCTPQDKSLLEEIAREDGDSSMSAALRKMIRNTAADRGLGIPPAWDYGLDGDPDVDVLEFG